MRGRPCQAGNARSCPSFDGTLLVWNGIIKSNRESHQSRIAYQRTDDIMRRLHLSPMLLFFSRGRISNLKKSKSKSLLFIVTMHSSYATHGLIFRRRTIYRPGLPIHWVGGAQSGDIDGLLEWRIDEGESSNTGEKPRAMVGEPIQSTYEKGNFTKFRHGRESNPHP